MYLLIQFTIDSTTGIVHESWVEEWSDDEILVSYPPKAEYSSLRRLLSRQVPASSLWQSFQAKIIDKAGNFLGVALPSPIKLLDATCA